MSAAALFMFSLFLLIVFSDNGLVEYGRLRASRSEIKKSNEELVDENRGLYRVISRLREDSAYIEMIARKEFGMIGSDELIFKFQNDGSVEKQ